jgi:hypothetical protein
VSDAELEQSVRSDGAGEIESESLAVDAVEPTPDGEGTPEAAAPKRRRPDRGLMIACFVIACGLTGIVWGVGSALTGQDGVDRPGAIENLSPVENAQQVVQQEQIVVDLQFGFEAALVVDGVELPTIRIGEFEGELTPRPGQQVEAPSTAIFDPGNARIEFRPSDEALITSYSEGRHQVQVIFWPIEVGRENGARSYRWSFDVV